MIVHGTTCMHGIICFSILGLLSREKIKGSNLLHSYFPFVKGSELKKSIIFPNLFS